ncbi:MAG: GH25 family lysozyme [Lachnospiraceae bacterium]|nr:GH25 family lysozyme [Lachnospiraceae bacterium]
MKNRIAKLLSMALIIVCLSGTSSLYVSAASWKQNTSGWWYENDDGSYPSNQWKQVDGKWYYFNSSGYMVTGWQTIGGAQYYFHASGVMATYWQHLNNQWVYFDPSGEYMGNPSKNGRYFADNTIKGIDVSHYQGDINWSQVKSEGISFAMVRLGHGSQKLDTKYAANMRGAASVGIPTGVYFYSKAQSEAQAISDAQYVIDNMRGYNISYPVAIDLEDSSQAFLGTSGITAIAKAFCDEIRAAGYTPMVYCNTTWAKNYIDFNALPGVERWIAQYNYYYDTSCPRDVWQSSSKTVLNGITANTVDVNFSYVNYVTKVVARTSPQPNYTKSTGIWRQDATGWWYEYLNGGYPTNCWKQIHGCWYYFDSRGYIVQGWQQLSGNWYYFDASGAMVTGWLYSNGNWFYLSGSGAMTTGWQQIGGSWYYFDGNGAMTTGWQQIGGSWYYMNASGAMVTGWLYSNGNWFCLSGSGAMLSGWQIVNGNYYYFFGGGNMASNEWVNGYWLDGSGAWTYPAVGSWKLDGRGWWFGDTSGWYARSTTQKINGVSYRFDSSGYIY